MRKSLIIMCLMATSCGGSGEDEASATGEPTTAMRGAEAQPSSPVEQIELSESDLIRACRAGASFRGSEPARGISGKANGDGTVRLSYIRKSDGKPFKYDCRASGNTMSFRMIDEFGPNTGPGNWSGRGSTITFKPTDNGFEFTESFGPGDALVEDVAID